MHNLLILNVTMKKIATKNKTALITGITGQDGAYLAQFLLSKGYKVYGTYRRLSTPNFWRLKYLNIFEEVTLISADLIDMASIIEAIKIAEPDELYNLAAQSFVGTSFEQPLATSEITGLGVSRILEAIKFVNPNIKYYQASTSEMYGNGGKIGLNKLQDEETFFCPASPYAIAKLYGYWITKVYRDGYGIFACNGILFNHESPLRGMEFVTRKITSTIARIKFGLEKELFLGNLEARRDWGYAPEYVRSMWLMLQQDKPDDYVIATGETHSVKEFLESAFNFAGLNWKKYVKINKKYLRPLDVNYLQGNNSKAKEILNWVPEVKFKQLVEIMMKEDLSRWERWLRGERFPWDDSAYSDEKKTLSKKMFLDR